MFAAVERSPPRRLRGVRGRGRRLARGSSPGVENQEAEGRDAYLALIENPDILATGGAPQDTGRALVIGFAAETENVIANAKAKLARKGCDWIVANDVSPATGVMGGDSNTVHLVTADGVESLAAAIEGRRSRARWSRGSPPRLQEDCRVTSRNPADAAAARRRPAAAGLSRASSRPASTCTPRCRPTRPSSSRRAAARQIPTGSGHCTAARTEGQVRPRSGLAPRHGDHGAEHARHGRLRLSRRNTRHPRESGPGAVRRSSAGTHCPDVHRVRPAGSNMREVCNLDETTRGVGGFGSTYGHSARRAQQRGNLVYYL